MENTDFGGIQFDLPKNQSNVIKVIGVGGGGSNAINHMFKQGIKGVDFIVCNTDSQALDNSTVPNKIQLGVNLTEGLGAGSNPEVGQQSALESIEDIEKMLDGNTKMVFITAGMGGGTGTGAAPVIAQLSKERDILTVGIVTIPFQFEGKVRIEQAFKGVDRLRKQVDSLVVINNNKLREVYGNLGFKAGFSKADEVLSTAARGIAEVITHHYTQNIDLKDAKTVLSDSGTAIMGSATASGENRAKEAIVAALHSPLLNDNKITGAKNVLLLIVSGTSEITLDEIGEINDHIQTEAGHNANIIMGVGEDESLGEAVAVTIIATGFNIEQQTTIATPGKPDTIIHVLGGDETKVQRELNIGGQAAILGASSPDQPLHRAEQSSEVQVEEQEQVKIYYPFAEDTSKEKETLTQTSSEASVEVKEVDNIEGQPMSESLPSESLNNVVDNSNGLDSFFKIVSPSSEVEYQSKEQTIEQVVNTPNLKSNETSDIRDIKVVEPEIVLANSAAAEATINKLDVNKASIQQNKTTSVLDAEHKEDHQVQSHGAKVNLTEDASEQRKTEDVVYFTLEDNLEKEQDVASAKPTSPHVEDIAQGFELGISTKNEIEQAKELEELAANFDEFENDEVNPLEMSLEEYSLRSRTAERRKKMKDFNYKFNTDASNSLVDKMDAEPAYKRTGISLESTPTDSSDKSRLSVSVDSNNDTKLRSNNSFLHDNVD
ncbi:cell division protein FtsZ [Myroides sp. LJL115]